MTKLGSRKSHLRSCIYPKVTKKGSITGDKIYYNGVGALRGQRHISSKNQSKYSPRKDYNLRSLRLLLLYWVPERSYLVLSESRDTWVEQLVAPPLRKSCSLVATKPIVKLSDSKVGMNFTNAETTSTGSRNSLKCSHRSSSDFLLCKISELDPL